MSRMTDGRLEGLMDTAQKFGWELVPLYDDNGMLVGVLMGTDMAIDDLLFEEVDDD